MQYFYKLVFVFGDVAASALGGIISAIIAALLVWAYLERRDRCNLQRIQSSLHHPYPHELACGKDLFIFHYANPIEKPIAVRELTLVLVDPKRTVRGVKPESIINARSVDDIPPEAFSDEPIPMIVPIRPHGREFNPLQPEPGWEVSDADEVSLLPGEAHCWWNVNLSDPGDYWFTDMKVQELSMKIVYESFSLKRCLLTLKADKPMLSMIQNLIDGTAKKIKKETVGG